jgi:N6-L-threonylcarbamoyladenine synthase
MMCLGVESTAHTFGCSIVESSYKAKNGKILSEFRSIYKPSEGSGIHPREASRHHSETCAFILKHTLENAKISLRDIDVIAYSAGPGLGPCLKVGAVVARTLATFYKKPLIPVNHALGHIELGTMLTKCTDPLVLLVSGGHTMILSFSMHNWQIFGETLDITIGQLLDQFGRKMGLASPCGTKIEELAHNSSRNYIDLPYNVKGNDVSYSGLLTAAIRLLSDKRYALADISYSLQETSFAMIVETVERALSFTGKKEFMVVGGVAANKRLEQMLKIACKRQEVKFYVCPTIFAGDNGAQIAWTGIVDYASTGRSPNIRESFVRQSWRLDTIYVGWRN